MSFLSRVIGLIGLLALACIDVTAQVTFPGPELLGRPTDHSVTINVVANAAIEAYFEYGTTSGGPYVTYPSSGVANPLSAAANVPLVLVLNGLGSNTRYFYRMVYRQSGTTTWTTNPEYSFQTQRPPGSTFTFTITSDSHLNINPFGNSSLFQQTLRNISNASPDFHLDLGDTFAMDNLSTQAQADNSYLNLRPYFGLISHSAPVFLALGNHEQNEGWHLNDTGNPATSPPVMSANARNRYYLNPDPLLDAFYTGNADNTISAITGDHSIGDYYAWQWGDALFVVIDPYWYSTTKPYIGNLGGGEPGPGSGDRWDWTLGIDQYLWLEKTLKNSTAKYKFLFAHQVPGGTSDYGRGGANAVPYVEMGGYNTDGTTYAFDPHRPNWPMPVHQLLVSNHVTAFFHGHDHVFAYEKRDGVVYQEVPMAADATYGLGFQEYHETDPYTIRVLPNSGHIRVTVSPSQVTVDYVRTFLPGAGTNGQVAHSYNLAALVSPISIASPSILPSGSVNATYTQTMSASGGTPPYSNWTVTSGSLPSSLSLNPVTGIVSGTPTGSGTFNFTIAVQDSSGATGSGTFQLTIQPFTSDELGRIGSFAQIASGGGWKTTMTLINLSDVTVRAQINFYANNGSPMTLPLTFPQSGASTSASSVNWTLNPTQSLVVQSATPGSTVAVGWADVQATGTLSGYSIFALSSSGVPDSDGAAPLDGRLLSSLVLPYDNTNGYQTGIALANQASTAASITAILLDQNGVQLASTRINLAAFAHTSFFLKDQFSQSANQLGIIQFQSTGGVTGLGLRFNPSGSFTSVPIIR